MLRPLKILPIALLMICSDGDEIVEGEKKREEGILEGFDISISQANDLIMSARVKLGIIPEEDEIIGENEEGDGQNNETDNIVNVID